MLSFLLIHLAHVRALEFVGFEGNGAHIATEMEGSRCHFGSSGTLSSIGKTQDEVDFEIDCWQMPKARVVAQVKYLASATSACATNLSVSLAVVTLTL